VILVIVYCYLFKRISPGTYWTFLWVRVRVQIFTVLELIKRPLYSYSHSYSQLVYSKHLWYMVLTVKVANKHTCTMFGGVPLRSMSGYLAAITASKSSVGSVECPWLLDIQPGQHVNITVYGGLSPSHSQLGSYCLVALVIQDDNKTTLLPGCTPTRLTELINTVTVDDLHDFHLSVCRSVATYVVTHGITIGRPRCSIM